MKTLYSILLLLLTCLPHVYGQLVIDSTRFITGVRPGTSIKFSIPTSDKGILFVGEEYGNPGGIIPYFPIDTGIDGNVLIGKIDSNQQISWIKVYGGSNTDGAGSACQTPDGGYAVLAGTASSDGDVTGFLGVTDIWLLRIDSLGNLLWEKCYGSPDEDGAISIANTPDHGFVILGVSNGSGDDVPFHYGSTGYFDWVVIKTDSIGNVQWSKDLGGTGDEGDGAILAIDSAYYIVSNSNSTDHDCTDSFWHIGVPTGLNIYILKLDDTGKVLWDSSYGGTGSDDANYAMFDTRDSTIVAVGFTYSNNYMVTGYQGDGDMWVVKVNTNGTPIWEKTLGSTNMENGTGICAGPNGGYIVYGSTYPGPIGGEDCWVFALDSTHNEISNIIFGGSQGQDPNSVLPYLNGYVTTGLGGSSFTEGTTYGNFDSVGGGFVSYIDYWPLGVKNINNYVESIAVYPNPSNENITIVTPQNINGNILCFNSMGQEIFSQKTEQGNKYNQINVSGWISGMYLIKWQAEDGNVETTKFVKN